MNYDEIKDLINYAMTKRNCSILITITPETGCSIGIYPWPDAEDLWDMYKDGKITRIDFRSKLRLPYED